MGSQVKLEQVKLHTPSGHPGGDVRLVVGLLRG